MKGVTTSEDFSIPSTQATAAVSCAEKVVLWCEVEANKAVFSTFARNLESLLESCFKDGGTLKVKKEKMWTEYHKLRTTAQYTGVWKSFLKNCNCPHLPTFFQYISDVMIEAMIKKRYAIDERKEKRATNNLPPLSTEEEMALRYVAGYVCRKVREKLEPSQSTKKEEQPQSVATKRAEEKRSLFNLW